MHVVLLWHLHQPDYRVDGRFLRPWTYLHALSGYTEMAARLEAAPEMRAVVNVTPVLADQLDDYARRLARWRRDGRPIGDALLDALAAPPPPGEARADVVQICLTALASPRADRAPGLRTLAEAVARENPAAIDDETLERLLAAFHVAWLCESRRGDPRAARLVAPGARADRDARHGLVALIADAVADVLPRWRALGEQSRVELATSPFYHPLSPLLLDFGSALDRAPAVELPGQRYPGGAARLDWHLAEGLARFQALFGERPRGCWPPEAAVSEESLAHLARAGFTWTASSRSVLEATFAFHETAPREPYRLFRSQAGLHLAFRDDGLSDRIGFEYQHWDSAEAVGDLVGQLEAIAREPGRELVLIALDGENPWEWYRDDGRAFLRGLYETLAAHPLLRPATMQDCVRELGAGATPLPALRAGSWVHGELLTWIGHPEKNRAWELLIEAKRQVDAHGTGDPSLLHRLGACEGSDWFWWPGIHNPAPSVAQFDALFRAQLASLYAALRLDPPAGLARPFASGVGHAVAAGGTMQRGA